MGSMGYLQNRNVAGFFSAMKLPKRFSVLCFLGFFAAGSSALGYYYYYVYNPPLQAAEEFMRAMAARDPEAVRRSIIISSNLDVGELRDATDEDIRNLLSEPFQRGRIL